MDHFYDRKVTKVIFYFKRLLKFTYPFLILISIITFLLYQEYILTSELDVDEPVKDEKFLTYLPHSQFHNQLIALKNAIVLAYLTNRTLIVPPILQFARNRHVNIAHSPLESLYPQLNSIINIRKSRLSCDVESQLRSNYCSSNYTDYDSFIMINWEEIFDFSWVKRQMRIIHRGYDFSIEGLFEICHIPIKESGNISPSSSSFQDLLLDNANVHVINHRNKYHYRFFDTVKPDNNYRLKKYEAPYLISDLRDTEERLIHLDTLFGSSRIDYKDKRVIQWMTEMNRSLKISHPILLEVTSNIINELGGSRNFLGAHVRTSDGIFKKHMQVTIDRITQDLKNRMTIDLKDLAEIDSDSINVENLSLNECKLQNKQIIFIATDSLDPRTQLSRIFSTFPCTFTLEDFQDFVDPLRNVTYTFDKNVKMLRFFYPLLDLLIIANSKDIISTPSSTFSGFAKSYHRILNF